MSLIRDKVSRDREHDIKEVRKFRHLPELKKKPLKPSSILDGLIDDVIAIKQNKVDKFNLKKEVTPVVELSIKKWLDNIEKFDVKFADRDQLIQTLSTVIIELLDSKVVESKEELSQVLYPIIGIAIKKQVAENPEPLIDSLYPIIGKTVSKYVSEAFKELVDKVDEKLDKGLSINRWINTVKAKRLGLSESAYLIRKTLPFVLEDVFLIDKKSGLLISHVSYNKKGAVDEDLIAGMLTAIKDFVSTAFKSNNSNSGSLQEIHYGDQKIYLEETSSYYLAFVIHGNKGNDFHDAVLETITDIQKLHGQRLNNFDGDIDKLEGIEKPLEALIDTTNKVDEANKKKPVSKVKIVGVIALTFLLYILGAYTYQYYEDKGIKDKVAQLIDKNERIKNLKLDVSVNSSKVLLAGILPDKKTLNNIKTLTLKIDKVVSFTFDGSILEDYLIAKPGEMYFKSGYIEFASGQLDLLEEHKKLLHDLSLVSKMYGYKSFELAVYLDVKDSYEQNLAISKKRMESVKNYLINEENVNEKQIISSIIDIDKAKKDPHFKPRSIRVQIE